ncbi:hypothetical protein FB45DRAFT_1138288 [Roridomyces roridus]|uniref:Uncharacterized protein n=1 Tax=Roridomyces roridus TaxID=1738132 RepID=A0AAD7C368_9AGAR|nr:hypothetical protein FB45DRAFT_1138288 [Roridomyces roridus]
MATMHTLLSVFVLVYTALSAHASPDILRIAPMTSVASPSTTTPTSSSSAHPTSASPTSDTHLFKRAPTFAKRDVILVCILPVEPSCSDMVANCMDTVSKRATTLINNLWSVESCVAAATCYGVGNLITSVECQTGLTTTNLAQPALNTTIYTHIVGSCAALTCNITQQNYLDFYANELGAINAPDRPTSNATVVAWWTAITKWTGTGKTVPYSNFTDWLHNSSQPDNSVSPLALYDTTSVSPPIPYYSQIDWNPNPAPSPGASSQTFVKGTSTKVIAVPTTTTSVVLSGTTITLAPGGTPINGPVPSGISQPGAVTPSWNPNIIPPTSVSSMTFTAPPSYTSVVAVPKASSDPPKNITGPPGDKNSLGVDWWLLLFPGILGGLLPLDIGIPGGITPTAAPPDGWTGSWSDPDPTRTSTSVSKSSSHSASSTSTCPIPVATYALPDDPVHDDDEDEDELNENSRRRTLVRRENRHIGIADCAIFLENTRNVKLKGGDYFSIGLKVLPGGVGPASTSTTLSRIGVNKRPVGNGAKQVAQEHLFEYEMMAAQLSETVVLKDGQTSSHDTALVVNRTARA